MRRGITLIEVLVVVGILGVLFGIVYTMASSLRKRAQILTCMHNLRQIGIALRLYREDWGVEPLRKGLPASYWMDPQSWAKLGLPVWHDLHICFLSVLGYADEKIFECPAGRPYPDTFFYGCYFLDLVRWPDDPFLFLKRCFAEQWASKGERTIVVECRAHNRRGKDRDEDGLPDLIWEDDEKIDTLLLVLRFDGSVGKVWSDVPRSLCEEILEEGGER